MTPTVAPAGRSGWVVLAVAGATALVGCAPSPKQHHRLDIRDLAFAPATLEVAPGDTISWTNHDLVPHTVTGAGLGDSGAMARGVTFTAVVVAGDTTRYTCRYHPVMDGMLVVRAR